jgi:hypothetical protein
VVLEREQQPLVSLWLYRRPDQMEGIQARLQAFCGAGNHMSVLFKLVLQLNHKIDIPMHHTIFAHCPVLKETLQQLRCT